MWKNQTPATTAWHLLPMLVTSLLRHCCGTASHSSTSIYWKSVSMVVLITLFEQHIQAIPTSVQCC